jgi:hypothetical protein
VPAADIDPVVPMAGMAAPGDGPDRIEALPRRGFPRSGG